MIKKLLAPSELILPIAVFLVERTPENGGNMRYEHFEALESDFAEKKLHPGDLKAALERELNALLDPIRQEFVAPEMQELLFNAYPEAKPNQPKPKSAFHFH